MKFGFVILHYLTIEDTVKCITSINKFCNSHNYNIIVVDNNSNNNSGEILKNKYKDKENIHFIISKKNLGFSAGNNLGFKYAKYNLKCDYIVMLNNDTYLLDSKFIPSIVSEYQQSNCAVVGPYILNLRDEPCSPVRSTIPTIKIADIQIAKYFLLYYMSCFRMERIFEKIVSAIRSILSKTVVKKIYKHHVKRNFDYNKRYVNVQIHGCCMIFTPQFVEKFDGLQELTYFYGEEEILYILMNFYSLKIVYNPQIKIFHYEEKSTKIKIKSSIERDKFIYKNWLNNWKVIKNLLILNRREMKTKI